jgi:hypothetical protein
MILRASVNARSEGAATTDCREEPSTICNEYATTRQTREPSQLAAVPRTPQTSATLPKRQQDAGLDAIISATSADCSFIVHCDAVRSLSTPGCSRRGLTKLSLSSRASDD